MPVAKHTGQTEGGNTRDVKVERVRNVTIYRRGVTFFLYFRENGKSVRRKVDGNLAVARATASKIAAALDEHRPSPLGFERIAPQPFVLAFLDYTANVQNLALRTQDRYRAALDRFLEFAAEAGFKTIDQVTPATVEDFVKWLRKRTRARNGNDKGKKEGYKIGGIQFILEVCRTAFNWGMKRRHLPPFTENQFSSFPIDKMRDRDSEAEVERMLTPTQQEDFFKACTDWQRTLFSVLGMYGLRVGEFTHLLIEDVDLNANTVHIRSKPSMFWYVKTGRQRVLPLFPGIKEVFQRAIGGRRAGFVFLNEDFADGTHNIPVAFATPRAFHERLQRVVDELRAKDPGIRPAALARETRDACRVLGQIPERRVRQEFMKLTKLIGRPELTRAHDLRHLFASRAQEMGINPLLVQELLGHKTLDMTWRYTHLGMEAKREALQKASAGLLGQSAAGSERPGARTA